MTAVARTKLVANHTSNLLASKCRVCGETSCPPRLQHCGQPCEETFIEPVGRLVASTTIRFAPEGHQAPYAVGYVHLTAGPVIVAVLESGEAPIADAGGAVRITVNDPADGLPPVVGHFIEEAAE